MEKKKFELKQGDKLFCCECREQDEKLPCIRAIVDFNLSKPTFPHIKLECGHEIPVWIEL